MEGRKSLLWACSLWFCAGCLGGGVQKTPPSSTPAPSATNTAAMDMSAQNDPKKTPRLVLAYAKFKEGEAKALDRDPEQQVKVRDQARQLYQDVLKLDATCIEAHRGLGRVYVDLNDFERASDVFKKAQAKFPKESVFWFELGQMHNRKKDFTAAAQCLKQALDMDPENRLYLTTLGLTLARAGRTDQSLAILARSMGAASAHYNVARMLLHLQRTEEGMQHLREAVKLNPGLESARRLLSEMENGTGQPNVSIDLPAAE